MNAEILRLIKTELKDDMKKRGFKTSGQWYMRYANAQVYQTINFQGRMIGGEFTVNIGLSPALDGNTNPKCELFRLEQLTGGQGWWDYTQASAMDVVAKIRETVLPMFDNCATYRGMFDLVKDILLDDNYDYKVNRNTPPDMVYRRICETTWAKILISINELEYCKEMMCNLVKLCENCLKRDLKKVEDEKACETNPQKLHTLDVRAQELQTIWTSRSNEYKFYLAAIESGNLSEILAEIKENETKSVDALMKYVVTVK